MKHKWYFLVIVICLKFAITVSKAVGTSEIENGFPQGGSNVLAGSAPINFDDINKLMNDAYKNDEQLSNDNGNGKNQFTGIDPATNEDKNQFTGIDPSTYEALDFIRNRPVITAPPYVGYETYAKEAEEENKKNQIFFNKNFLWHSIYVLIGIFVLKIIFFLIYTRRKQVVTLTRTSIYRPTTTTTSPPSQRQRPSQSEALSETDNPPLYEDAVVNIPQNIPLVNK